MDSSPSTESPQENQSGTKISKNTLIVIVCMGIAAMLWLLTKLSHDYIGEIPATISYVNLPEDKVVVRPLRRSLKLIVETSGFKLLISEMTQSTAKVQIDYTQYGRANAIHTNEFLPSLTNQLSGDYTVLDISPDTLFFYFDNRVSKMVPIQADYHITFEKQYDFMEPLVINPDSVLVAGPKSLVDSITKWKTKKLNLENLKSSVQTDVDLVTPEKDLLDISPLKVQYVIPVEKYTEQSIDLEIIVINAPAGYEVNIYPKVVKAVFQVGLNNYEKVKGAIFEAVVDFKKIDIRNSKYAEVEIRKAPRYIKKLNYTPKSVEYIIYN